MKRRPPAIGPRLTKLAELRILMDERELAYKGRPVIGSYGRYFGDIITTEDLEEAHRMHQDCLRRYPDGG